MTPIMMRAATGHGSASWIATVDRSASAKPKARVFAFSRHGAEAEKRRGDESDRYHPEADAGAVDNVLADEEPHQIGWARPARHGARLRS
jgi:hypothetical protein